MFVMKMIETKLAGHFFILRYMLRLTDSFGSFVPLGTGPWPSSRETCFETPRHVLWWRYYATKTLCEIGNLAIDLFPGIFIPGNDVWFNFF